MIERVEAKPFHCGQIVRRLRAEHRDLIMGMGVKTHRELRDKFDASMWRRAWLLDGKIVALAGITGTSISTDGVIWLALSNDAQRIRYTVSREALRQIDALLEVKHRLTTIVFRRDRAALGLAYFLGFDAGEPMIVNGEDAIIMVRARSKLKEVA